MKSRRKYLNSIEHSVFKMPVDVDDIMEKIKHSAECGREIAKQLKEELNDGK